MSREFNGAYAGDTCPSGQLRGWVSAEETAKQLGTQAERLVDAVARGAIGGEQYYRGFGHRHTVIEKVPVETISATRGNFIDNITARGILGISRKQYDLVLSVGFFYSSLPMTLPPLVSGPFDLASVKQIVQGIASRARMMTRRLRSSH